MCGEEKVSTNLIRKSLEMCDDCFKEMCHDLIEIEKLETKGHSYHCSCRQVWGDGECECELQKGFDK